MYTKTKIIALSDVIELFETISEAIIDNLNGVNSDIPYFKYIGAYKSRKGIPTGRNGIYVFTVDEQISLTPEMIKKYNYAVNWSGKNVGAGFNRTDIRVVNINDIFYLGKSSGNSESIYQRLKVHFGDRTDSDTNGIKMKMKERNFVVGKLSVHVFLFEYRNKYSFVINEVEKILHNKLKPITGGSQ